MLRYSVDGRTIKITTDDKNGELDQLQDDVTECMPGGEVMDWTDATTPEQFAAGVTIELDGDDRTEMIMILDGIVNE